MAFRLAVIISIIAIASAGVIDYQAAGPVSVPLVKSYAPTVVKAVSAPVYKQLEYDAPAEYEFNYAVHDEHTGDIKSQQESRKGDVVQGYYELIEPDGHRRIVEYTADAHNGFNAVVHREPTNIQIPQQVPQVQKIISPVAQYAPVAKFTYAAPVTKAISYSAPVAKVIAAPTVAKYAVPATHYSSGHENSQVTFNGPSSNYHY